MKKMTMPLQLRLRRILWHTLILTLGMYANPLSAQVTNNLRTGALVERFDYAKVQDNTLSQLDAAASELASTLDSAFQIQDFKVFDFGLYLPTLRMIGQLSFDQAASDMYNRIETGGVIAFRNPTMPILRNAAPPAAYVLITHQFQGGGNVRFSMIVKIPGMSQTGADVSGVEKAMALAGQRAMEAAYQKNSHEDNVAAAKAEGLRAIKRFISGKANPVEAAGGGFVLQNPMNFVALSGKIIQLPAGAIVHSYCVAPDLTNGYLIGFTIDKNEWVVGGNEFLINQSSFLGYQLRGKDGVFYTNKVQLNPGKLLISFVHREPTGPKEKIVQLFTEEKNISSDRIEPLNGTFSSSTRLSSLDYDSSKQPVGETTEDKAVCGKHKDIVQMANRMGGDIEIVIQKGKSDEPRRFLLDSDGNESIPIKKNDPVKAKGRITYVEEGGKITGANAELNRDKIRPGRNDYKSTEGGNSDPLKASEDVINTAINNAFKRAEKKGTEMHEGWNDAAIGTIGRFHCETMPLTGIAVVIVDVGISIYESSALPEQVWNEPPGTTAEKGGYPIHGPPVVCGVADGVIGEVTEIPQLVKMGVDLASSPENVKALVASIADITPAKIVELAQGEIKKKWENYTGPSQVVFHTGGKDAVVVATVLLGVGSILEVGSEFKDAIQETGEAISRGLDNLLTALRNKLKNKKLFSRLQDAIKNLEIKELFTRNPDAVKAWELLTENANTKIINHSASLEKLADLMLDADFMAKLPGGETTLKEILAAVKNPLNTGTEAKLVNLATHLDNIKAIVKNHSGTEGFDRLMTDLKNPNFYMQDGVTHMLESLKNFPAGSIKKFDYEFEAPGTVCTKCRFDVEMVNGQPKLIEYKSWDLQYIPNIASKQLIEYFRSANAIEDIRYVFNSLKTPSLDAVKEQMQKLLRSNSQDLFAAMNHTFREALLGPGNSNRFDLFQGQVENINSNLYKFITNN